jgi:hypothetical protein
LEVANYHSGAQRGSIRIPEGSRGQGWAKLVSELWSFFLGREEKNIVVAKPGATSVGDDPARVTEAINGNSDIVGSSRDPRAFCKLVAPITPPIEIRDSCHNSNSQLVLDPKAPRPTRKSYFEWKPHSKTLRITKSLGVARQAQWVSLKYKAVGLAQQCFRL